MLWREKSNQDQIMRQPLVYISWIRSYPRLMYFLPVNPRWKYGGFCHPGYGQRVHFIRMSQHTCRLIVLRIHGGHFRLMNGTCHPSFSCWKQAGFSVPVQISRATKVQEVYSRADLVPLNIFLSVWRLSPIFQPMQWPPSKSHKAEGNDGYISPYGKTVINLRKKKKPRERLFVVVY